MEYTWERVTALPRIGTLRALSFPTVNTGYAVGEYGIVLRTADGGGDWNVVAIPTGTSGTLDWYAITFSSHLIGYLAGQPSALNGLIELYKTIDGGRSWSYLCCLPTRFVFHIVFPTTNIGFVVGGSGKLFRTLDGGSTWEIVSVLRDVYIQYLVFPNSDVGYATDGTGRLLRTLDIGRTWQRASSPPDGITGRALAFPSSSVGYAGSGDAVFRTNDGAMTWQQVFQKPGTRPFLLAFSSADEGYAVGSGGSLMRTTDPSSAWESVSSPVSVVRTANALTSTGPDLACLVGTRATLATTIDRGLTWRNHFLGFPGQASALAFPTLQEGFAFTDDGQGTRTFRTRDGGRSWEEMAQIPSAIRHTVCFPSATIGYVVPVDFRANSVDSQSQVLKTDDGGRLWSSLSLGVPEASILDIAFITPQKGFVVGSYGMLLRTRDGGGSWEERQTKIEMSISSINFFTPAIGFAAASGTLLYTSDGGDSWDLVECDLDLRVVWCFDSRVIYARDADDYMYQSYDKGVSWWKIDQLSKRGIIHMAVTGRNLGYAIGTASLLLSTDGWRTWKEHRVAGPPGTLVATHKPDGQVLLVSTEGELLALGAFETGA